MWPFNKNPIQPEYRVWDSRLTIHFTDGTQATHWRPMPNPPHARQPWTGFIHWWNTPTEGDFCTIHLADDGACIGLARNTIHSWNIAPESRTADCSLVFNVLQDTEQN